MACASDTDNQRGALNDKQRYTGSPFDVGKMSIKKDANKLLLESEKKVP